MVAVSSVSFLIHIYAHHLIQSLKHPCKVGSRKCTPAGGACGDEAYDESMPTSGAAAHPNQCQMFHQPVLLSSLGRAAHASPHHRGSVAQTKTPLHTHTWPLAAPHHWGPPWHPRVKSASAEPEGLLWARHTPLPHPGKMLTSSSSLLLHWECSGNVNWCSHYGKQ